MLSLVVTMAAAKEVALLMAGHARTYELTAPSLKSRLIDKNNMQFSVFAIAYTSGERKPSLHSKEVAAPIEEVITVDILRRTYASLVPADRLVCRVITENDVAKRLPSRLRSPKDNPRDRQRSRISAMFRMIAVAHDMVRTHERSVKRRFDVVIKFRFDLKILDDFVLRPDLVTDQAVVVPERMDHGPSHFSPNQLRTRPCDIHGHKRPTWVQDHVAYGSSRAMELFCNGTARHVAAGPRKRQTQPEFVLATSLLKRKLAVKCDPSIHYTILR